MAPLALVAAAVAVVLVVQSSESRLHGRLEPRLARRRRDTAGRSSTTLTSRPPRRTYTVKAGDTLSAIAQATGVSLSRSGAQPATSTRARCAPARSSSSRRDAGVPAPEGAAGGGARRSRRLARARARARAPRRRRAPRPPRSGHPRRSSSSPPRGDVVYARNADQRRPIASTTKLMTALLALERLPLDDVLSAVPLRRRARRSRVAGIRAGERLTVRDYLRALLVQSANDAAQTLAVRVAGSRKAFVALMNRRARQLGLQRHPLHDPGRPRRRGQLLDGVRPREARPRPAHPRLRARDDRPAQRHDRHRVAHATFRNQNGLVRTVPWVNGVKTGHTRGAGYVLVGSGTRDGVTVLSAVLGDPTDAAREQDSLALLRYGLAALPRRAPGHQGAPLRGRAPDLPRPGRPARRVADDRPRHAPRRAAAA